MDVRAVNPPVSLLMPNRDNAVVLDLVLGALARNTTYPNFEVVVVDDGSTDGSLEILRDWRASGRLREFTLVEHAHGPGGVVDALNRGLEVAGGELVVQLDADASVETPGWLERMVSFFTLSPRIGVVTGRVVLDSGELQTCGIDVVTHEGYHDRGTEIAEPIGRRTSHQQVRRCREDQCPSWCHEVAEVDGGMGACMMYRRSDAIGVGGYDRGYAPVWLDDLDLTISLRRAGLKVFYIPDVRVVHHMGKRARPDDGVEDAPARRMRQAVRNAAGAVMPSRTRARLVRALGWDRGPREFRRHVAGHYAYWREKWGWDLLNPDIRAIQARWGETEICWRTNAEMRHVGEEIIAAAEAT